MKVAQNDEEIEVAFRTARSEAKAAFGNDEVYIEKYLQKSAPHRDSGLWRRQRQGRPSGRTRLLVATPPPEGIRGSPGPGHRREEIRAKIGKVCADAVAAINYIGAGTIEFLYEDGEFYFIEMNTRCRWNTR
jgi:acetyl-CoA carboxylase biotin carboxylase subunit